MKIDFSTIWAVILYKLGKKPRCSTFIDEDTITVGYGKLHAVGTFQYPLPKKIIIKMYGSISWNSIIGSALKGSSLYEQNAKKLQEMCKKFNFPIITAQQTNKNHIK